MKILKGIGIFMLVLVIVIIVLLTLYFLFANDAYGISVLTKLFEDGILGGIKNFFVDLWNGILYVFKA